MHHLGPERVLEPTTLRRQLLCTKHDVLESLTSFNITIAATRIAMTDDDAHGSSPPLYSSQLHSTVVQANPFSPHCATG
jgi:hypothetical protein